MNSEEGRKILIIGSEPRVAFRSDSDQRTVVIYGSPSSAVGGTFDIHSPGNFADEPSRDLGRLNGEFVGIVETTDEVLVTTDRFASHPVFYLVARGRLVISFSYQAMWRWLSDENRLDVEPMAFFEFIHFQRLFGSTTYDRSSKALTPATTLVFKKSSSEISLSRYWLPGFEKRRDGRSAIARDLADAVKTSVARKTADKQHPLLLLSGGMDSRVVLGGFSADNRPHCVTIGVTENNEVDVARSLANAAGAEHSFVPRSKTHYTDIFAQSTATGGGMYSFAHGHFFGLDVPQADVIFHGHGFDYFFQGMYLPSRRRSFLGRPTRSWTLEPVGDDLVGQYIQQAKYRLKGVDSWQLLRPGIREEARERLRADLESVLKPIRGKATEVYDEWDYLTTSAPGRHYTYLNLLSVDSLAEQRTIAFDNDIFNTYYATPAEIRHGTQLLAEATRYLNPDLLEIRNANTNLGPDLSPMRLTIDSWSRGVRRRMGLGGSISADPAVADRSWPSEFEIIRKSPELVSAVEQLPNSSGIGALEIFDEKGVADLVSSFGEGHSSGASALLLLLTIDEFLSNGRCASPSMNSDNSPFCDLGL